MRVKASGSFVVAGACLCWGVLTAAPTASPQTSPSTAAAHDALLVRYCLACHSTKARAAGVDSARKLALDTLDLTEVARDARTWELVARKLRAGMM
ncbi:MAG: hypothetical protein ACREF4_19710, partial [Gammaproteobacteria bacterium]